MTKEIKDLQEKKKLLAIPAKKFKELYSTDYSAFTEQIPCGGGFIATYISWSHAYRLLKENFEDIAVDFELDANGSVAHYTKYSDKVFCEVRPYLTDGISRTPCIYFPVMNPRSRYSAVSSPDSRQISDACLRGAVKAIATYTGIGLTCYTGEDFPDTGLDVVEQGGTATASDEAETVAPYAEQSSALTSGKKTFLNCSFKDKDKVKQLGAFWDKDQKKWYVPEGKDLNVFASWIEGSTEELAEEVSHDETQVDNQATEEIDEDVPF